MQDDHTIYALNEISEEKVVKDRELANYLKNGNNLYMQAVMETKESNERNMVMGMTAGAITPLLATYALYRTAIPKQPGMLDDIYCIGGAIITNLGPVGPYFGLIGGGIASSLIEVLNYDKKRDKKVKNLNKFVKDTL